MRVKMFTAHSDTCKELLSKYIELFTEKPALEGNDDSLIWLDYATYDLEFFWRAWIVSATKIGLIYDGDIK